jgi:transposase InsO family protein
MSRFRFIDAERAAYPSTLLCRVLQVSRAGYYAWAHRGPSARARADAHLTEQIRQVHTRSRATYGAPRVHADLSADGIRVGRTRVARLMRTAGLTGCGRRRRAVRTTVADPTATPAPNVVARDFHPTARDRLWVGDITYVPTDEGWLSVATRLDACSRRVVGWAMAAHLRTELALDALIMALTRRRPAADELVQHTDRGCQYTADRYQAVLAAHGLICSMSRTGDCYDNAMAESFFATLKAELIDRQRWPTRAAARHAIFEWMEVWYNRQRRHSALGYLSPAAFERRQAGEVAA